jgi:hypothetical protein
MTMIHRGNGGDDHPEALFGVVKQRL